MMHAHAGTLCPAELILLLVAVGHAWWATYAARKASESRAPQRSLDRAG
jgi:hypothetical protein